LLQIRPSVEIIQANLVGSTEPTS